MGTETLVARASRLVHEVVTIAMLAGEALRARRVPARRERQSSSSEPSGSG